ncbi:MAG: DNA polymerase III subunit delta' [Candidatus Hydrogenedentes bacterium]|nr:DNA polymerase III subunit delta' [Candidatus Hydrogenedentota bacterium]
MSFADIRDQEIALRLLRNFIEHERIPNGLLFWGPGGVGKQLAAIEFAKALNCREAKIDACGQCISCRKIAHGNHPDIRVLAPKDKSRMIKREEIDEVNEFASLRPFESQWRIFVMLDAERMNPSAQNHFLKTLEEPPGRSLFILISEHPRMLLPTIRSRCQAVRFRQLRRETVSELLRRDRDLPTDLADSIAEIAEGQMSRALDLVDSEKRKVAFSLVERLASGDDPVVMAEEFAAFLEDQRKQIEAAVKAEAASDAMDEQSRGDAESAKEERLALMAATVRRDIVEYLYLMQTWYRDVLVADATGGTGHVWNKDSKDGLGTSRGGDPGAKIVAIEQARVNLDRFIPEERVFRDLFFALAAR